MSTGARKKAQKPTKGLWDDEQELIILLKKRKQYKKLETESKASVVVVPVKHSVKEVAKSLQSQIVQLQEQKAKTKGAHPKHRLRRRISHSEASTTDGTTGSTPMAAPSLPSPSAASAPASLLDADKEIKPSTPPLDETSTPLKPPTPSASAASPAASSQHEHGGAGPSTPPSMMSPKVAGSPVPSAHAGYAHELLAVFDDDGHLVKKIRRISTVDLDPETLLSAETIMTGEKFALDALLEAKHKLTSAKDRLDPIVERSGRDAWAKHTAALNPSGQVVRHLRHHAQVEMGTNSWTKMWEVLCAVDDCIPADTSSRNIVRSLHLCEAPGAFVCATNHFVKTRMDAGTAFEWHGSTLNPRASVNEGLWMICDDKFMRHSRSHWLFGRDDTGQLMNVENIRDIWQRLGDHKVDLVTADGSLDSTHAPNDQEDIAAPLVFCEVVCALGALREGGTLVLKVFTLLEHHSVALMAMLGAVFEELLIMKPFTARHGNGELYLIALRFQGASVDLLERLLVHCNAQFPLLKSLIPLSVIPEKFVKAAVEASEFFASQQEQAINANLAFWHHFEPADREEVQRIRRMVADQFMLDFGVRALQPEHRLVLSEHVDGARQPGQPFGPVHSRHAQQPNSRRSWGWQGQHGHGHAPPPLPQGYGNSRHRYGTPGTPPSKRARTDHSSSPSQRLPGPYSPIMLPHSAEDSDSSPRSMSMSPPAQHLAGPLPFAWAIPNPTITDHLQNTVSEILGMSYNQLVEELLGTSLRRQHLAFVKPKEFMVSWLPDAPLSLLLILHEGVFVMPLDGSYAPILVPGLSFPKRKVPTNTVGRTIACGHLVVDKVDNDLIPRFLVTDILVFESYLLRKENHSLLLL